MTIMIYVGAALVVLGLVGIGYCLREAARLKKLAQEDPEAVRSRLHGLVAVNMGAVGLAFMGLALVVVGLIL
ncbi:MAG: hypothetical protein AAFQ51_13230 [Pseudomonadota bacterium]